MQRFQRHGPKAEAHGRAEQLSQAWFNSNQVLQRLYYGNVQQDEKLVAEPGIEPGTRGFSIPVITN